MNRPEFRVPNTSQQQSSHSPLVIPDLVHKSQTNNSRTNELPVMNHHFAPAQRSIQPFSPLSINNHSQQQRIQQHSPFSFRSDQSMHHQSMNNNAFVVARSVINPHNHRHLTDSSFRPHRSIVERNGKQFVTEFRERTERRYVQYFDPTIGQMRFFEVIDYIPSTIVRPIPFHSQSLWQNGNVQHPFHSKLRSNQRAALPPILRSRSELVTPSNLVNFNSLNNRENLTNQSNLHHNHSNLSSTNNTSENITNESSTIPSQQHHPLDPRLTIESVTDSVYPSSQHSQPKASNTPYIGSQIVPNQYSSEQFLTEPPSFRAHTPTNSEYSVPTSANNPTNLSEDSETEDDEENDRTLIPSKIRTSNNQTNTSFSNNRNSTAISYGAAAHYNSSTSLDPFARKNNTGDPMYRKRTTANNYAEPIKNNRTSHHSAYDDYALIPLANKRPNDSQHARRKESNESAYDG